MDSSKGRNVLSGSRSEEDCYIAPAVYVDVDNDDPLMQDEIFGPVLPIVTVDNLEEAIRITNKRWVKQFWYYKLVHVQYMYVMSTQGKTIGILSFHREQEDFWDGG